MHSRRLGVQREVPGLPHLHLASGSPAPRTRRCGQKGDPDEALVSLGKYKELSSFAQTVTYVTKENWKPTEGMGNHEQISGNTDEGQMIGD